MAYVTITLTAESSENSGPFDIIDTEDDNLGDNKLIKEQ